MFILLHRIAKEHGKNSVKAGELDRSICDLLSIKRHMVFKGWAGGLVHVS